MYACTPAGRRARSVPGRARGTAIEAARHGAPSDWTEWGRQCLGATDTDEDYLDYQDDASGVYRAARVVGDRLEACLYVSRRPELPDRGWLAELFAKPSLEDDDRMALLAEAAG